MLKKNKFLVEIINSPNYSLSHPKYSRCSRTHAACQVPLQRENRYAERKTTLQYVFFFTTAVVHCVFQPRFDVLSKKFCAKVSPIAKKFRSVKYVTRRWKNSTHLHRTYVCYKTFDIIIYSSPQMDVNFLNQFFLTSVYLYVKMSDIFSIYNSPPSTHPLYRFLIEVISFNLTPHNTFRVQIHFLPSIYN